MEHPSLALADAEPTPELEEWSEEMDVPLLLLRKEKSKAKELGAKVNEEKEGSEGHEDFEAGPKAAKIERKKAKKQQKKSSGKGPATRSEFDALGDDYMELKREVQGLQDVVLELKYPCAALKIIAHMLEHEEKPAITKGAKVGTKDKTDKSPPTVLTAARPIPT